MTKEKLENWLTMHNDLNEMVSDLEKAKERRNHALTNEKNACIDLGQGIDSFDNHDDRYFTLRGLVIRVYWTGTRPNFQCCAEIVPAETL